MLDALGPPCLSTNVGPYNVSMNSERKRVWRLVDRLIAAVLLVLFLPPMLTISLVVYLDSGAPVLLRSHYADVDGDRVGVLCFRTVGSVGAWLKKFSLDCFPALWDVLRGEIGIRDMWHLCKM